MIYHSDNRKTLIELEIDGVIVHSYLADQRTDFTYKINMFRSLGKASGKHWAVFTRKMSRGKRLPELTHPQLVQILHYQRNGKSIKWIARQLKVTTRQIYYSLKTDPLLKIAA